MELVNLCRVISLVFDFWLLPAMSWQVVYRRDCQLFTGKSYTFHCFRKIIMIWSRSITLPECPSLEEST